MTDHELDQLIKPVFLKLFHQMKKPVPPLDIIQATMNHDHRFTNHRVRGTMWWLIDDRLIAVDKNWQLIEAT